MVCLDVEPVEIPVHVALLLCDSQPDIAQLVVKQNAGDGIKNTSPVKYVLYMQLFILFPLS